MIHLSPEQQAAVDFPGNAVITACPGSGKTRVLTARLIRGLSELGSRRERVVALTFTNRAADEIQLRLDHENVPTDCLWAGTIHAFALEWILRTYAPYIDATRFGFTVADEFFTDQLLEELKEEEGLPAFTQINTAYDREGVGLNTDDSCSSLFDRYKSRLRQEKLIDYDDALYLAYALLTENPEIAANLASIIRLICVDEVQDIQDLQYGIISAIFRRATSPLSLFLVGDSDQSIYESLGALTKAPEQIASEFGLDRIEHLRLTGNYRSTQRIIDFYRHLRPGVPAIRSLAGYADDPGIITFEDQTVPKEDLAVTISGLISDSLNSGIAANDICVLAPHWWHVRSLARSLVRHLPHVGFDAPGLSPLHTTKDNLWFKLSRLFLTEPSPSRSRTRLRWAKDALSDLGAIPEFSLPPPSNARSFLRLINSISSSEKDGLSYLRLVFYELMAHTGLSLESSSTLRASFHSFFEKAQRRLVLTEEGLPDDVESFRRLFRHPSGVVVSTCHGVKGEEYDTVIAFGLLRGYVPHWTVVIKGSQEEAVQQESKLLYVICSRAKRRLHLIAETGRTTQKGKPYETSRLLRGIHFIYD